MSSEDSNTNINLSHSNTNEQSQSSNFSFNNNNKINETVLGGYSVTDSAYDSLVCSPFSPVIISNSRKSNQNDYQEPFPNTLDSISPFQESGETDDVFNVSLEQIYPDQKSELSMTSSTFRPISPEREISEQSNNNTNNNNNRNYYENETKPNVCLRQTLYTSSSKSHRSISTQTRFSLGSIGFYRPSSAPLQEGIEEELSEIETNAMDNPSFQMPRNSTCHCIRSPMPDLVQPIFQRDNQLLVSRLSLIADQIDKDMSPAITPVETRPRRTRRFSTPSLTEITPGGSFFDLLISIYQAFDNRAPRRRSTTFSYNENEENELRND